MVEEKGSFVNIPEMDSSSTLLWVERQLHHCQSSHTRCIAVSTIHESEKACRTTRDEFESQQQPLLPARLLDLSNSNLPIKL